MGRALFGEEDPTQAFFTGQAQQIHKDEAGNYVMTLPLPFTTKRDILLTRSGDELIVEIGNFRRNIVLPLTLVGREVARAEFKDSRLHIHFEREKSKRGEGNG